MSKIALRVMQDLVDFNNNKPDGIYLYTDKNNIFKNYALIIGPKNTPYFGGNFIFEINFPKNYPNSPPSVKLLTTNKTVRFNPNLYECGKVCLSILGTWNGPSWKKVMNLRLVLLSIQSLLNEFPVVNEPGFEDVTPSDEKSIEYNHYIIYYNYKIAIIEIINKLNKEDITYVDYFKNEIINEFKKNLKQLDEDIKSYQITIGEKKPKKAMYFMKNTNILDFIDLNLEFEKIKENFSLSELS